MAEGVKTKNKAVSIAQTAKHKAIRELIGKEGKYYSEYEELRLKYEAELKPPSREDILEAENKALKEKLSSSKQDEAKVSEHMA